MIGELKPYPEYKESGQPWLGSVPDHWDECRLSSRVTNVVVQTRRPAASAAYIALEQVESWTGRIRPRNACHVSDSTVKCFQAGDVLFGKLRPYLAKITRAKSDGVCVGEFFVLRPKDASLSCTYLEQLLRSKPVVDLVDGSTFGAKMPRADWSFVGSLRVHVPPPDEQAAIVKYLDHVDRKIDRYIRAKKKLIALLNEQKQAIVHRAVTRGVNSNGKLKPSGVEWLGDVPAHWAIRKLGSIACVFNGTTPSRMKPDYWEGGTIPWLASGKVNDCVVMSASELITDKAYRECSVKLVPKGSVILGLVGQGKTRGMSALLDIDACINQNLAAIVPLRGIDGRFILHLLTAFYRNVRELGRGGNQEALNCDIVSKMRLPVPPKEEQGALIDAIDGRTAAIVRGQSAARQEIELLQEYRTRLIADVVTGKLDVRRVATQLPDVLDEEPVEVSDDESESVADDALENVSSEAAE